MQRRHMLAGLTALLLAPATWPLSVDTPLPAVGLDPQQSDRFRAWMTLIVSEQIRTGPSPRWQHRDCAGLARFAVAEALRPHDRAWQTANGLSGRRLPPELELTPAQNALVRGWQTLDGARSAFATALVMVQQNCRPLGREAALARPGDFLFFDQGDDQHLMIWMGDWIAYHTGEPPAAAPKPRRGAAPASRTPYDHGLRAVTPAELLQWKDTRWRPRDDNPNFAGFYRLAFLSR